MSEKLLKLAVPTATLIIVKADNPMMVVVMRSAGKHGDKLVLPGGRLRVGSQGFMDAGLAEAEEEVDITDLVDIKTFCLCSKPKRDTRKITLKKYCDGNPIPENLDPEMMIEGHYGFDVVLTAKSKSKPVPDQDEAKEAFYMNVEDVKAEDFALDHGRILVAYRHYLKTGDLPGLQDF